MFYIDLSLNLIISIMPYYKNPSPYGALWRFRIPHGGFNPSLETLDLLFSTWVNNHKGPVELSYYVPQLAGFVIGYISLKTKKRRSSFPPFLHPHVSLEPAFFKYKKFILSRPSCRKFDNSRPSILDPTDTVKFLRDLQHPLPDQEILDKYPQIVSRMPIWVSQTFLSYRGRDPLRLPAVTSNLEVPLPVVSPTVEAASIPVVPATVEAAPGPPQVLIPKDLSFYLLRSALQCAKYVGNVVINHLLKSPDDATASTQHT